MRIFVSWYGLRDHIEASPSAHNAINVLVFVFISVFHGSSGAAIDSGRPSSSSSS